MNINRLIQSFLVASCVFLSMPILADDDVTVLSVSILNSTHNTMTLIKYEDSGIWRLLGAPWNTIKPTLKAPFTMAYAESDANKVGPIGSVDIVYKIPCPGGVSDQLIVHATAEIKMLKQFKIFPDVEKHVVGISADGSEVPAHCSACKNPVDSIRDRIVEIEVIPAGGDSVK